MLSFMTVDRVEGDFAVCEVEKIPTIDARIDDFFCISCFMADVPLTLFKYKGLPVQSGYVYTVVHNGETVDSVCNVDPVEKVRREKIISNLNY